MSESENTPDAPAGDDAVKAEHKAYWRANIRLVSVLMVVWFVISCVCGIYFVKELNTFEYAGFKLGLWIAQQGPIIVFILLLPIYCIAMGKIDKRYHVEDKDPY